MYGYFIEFAVLRNFMRWIPLLRLISRYYRIKPVRLTYPKTLMRTEKHQSLGGAE